MSDGIVIDANIIPKFYKELSIDSGYHYHLITWLSRNRGIAVNDYILCEWESVCSAPVFMDWITDELKNGRIRKIDSQPISRQIARKMRIDFGFPCHSLDLKYIECSNASQSTKYIMTENYDFYEPKCKRMSSNYKQRVREQRQGTFCGFLLAVLGIKVGMPVHCKADLNIPD